MFAVKDVGYNYIVSVLNWIQFNLYEYFKFLLKLNIGKN